MAPSSHACALPPLVSAPSTRLCGTSALALRAVGLCPLTRACPSAHALPHSVCVALACVWQRAASQHWPRTRAQDHREDTAIAPRITTAPALGRPVPRRPNLRVPWQALRRAPRHHPGLRQALRRQGQAHRRAQRRRPELVRARRRLQTAVPIRRLFRRLGGGDEVTSDQCLACGRFVSSRFGRGLSHLLLTYPRRGPETPRARDC